MIFLNQFINFICGIASRKIFIPAFFKNNYSRYYNMDENDASIKPVIIGYLHICQKEGWKRSFDLIMDRCKMSGLYENTKEIRVGVLSDDGELHEDERLDDKKITIIHIGKSEEYERPTLLHIKKKSETDDPNTFYYYLHTKGIRHFETCQESNVIDWINLMLFWNIDKWKTAIDIIQKDEYWTYGVNFTGVHYSGNFWWSKPSHIKRLSDHIPDYYTAPECWVTMLYWGLYQVPIHREYYSAFNSGLEGMGHYSNAYPESNYKPTSSS